MGVMAKIGATVKGCILPGEHIPDVQQVVAWDVVDVTVQRMVQMDADLRWADYTKCIQEDNCQAASWCFQYNN